MKNGKVLEKWSVEAYRKMHAAERLDVVRNPNTGKLFVVADDEPVAVVGNSTDLDGDLQFIRVLNTDGTTFDALCNRSTENVVKRL